MGTRGLTVIIKDGKVKLSQYQQYDSYFSETGVEFIDFCNRVLNNPRKTDKFESKIKRLQHVTKKYMAECDKVLELLNTKKYKLGINQLFPQFSRDTGVDILDIIYNLRDYEYHDEQKYPIYIDVCEDWIEYANIINFDTQEIYLTTANFSLLNPIEFKTINNLFKRFNCYLKYSFYAIPTVEQAIKDYNKMIKDNNIKADEIEVDNIIDRERPQFKRYI
jgi:hypothetical protein